MVKEKMFNFFRKKEKEDIQEKIIRTSNKNLEGIIKLSNSDEIIKNLKYLSDIGLRESVNYSNLNFELKEIRGLSVVNQLILKIKNKTPFVQFLYWGQFYKILKEYKLISDKLSKYIREIPKNDIENLAFFYNEIKYDESICLNKPTICIGESIKLKIQELRKNKLVYRCNELIDFYNRVPFFEKNIRINKDGIPEILLDNNYNINEELCNYYECTKESWFIACNKKYINRNFEITLKRANGDYIISKEKDEPLLWDGFIIFKASYYGVFIATIGGDESDVFEKMKLNSLYS